MRKRARRDVELASAARRRAPRARAAAALDNLDRALAAAEAEEADAEHHLTKGIRLVQQELLARADARRDRAVSPLGEPFDPHQHEAVAQQPRRGRGEPARSSQVYQPGYRYKDEVLRAAKVVVAA